MFPSKEEDDHGDGRRKIARTGIHKRAIYRFFESGESKKDGSGASESEDGIRARVSHVDCGAESGNGEEEEIHEPFAPIGSDWRVSGCLKRTGDRSDRSGEQVF